MPSPANKVTGALRRIGQAGRRQEYRGSEGMTEGENLVNWEQCRWIPCTTSNEEIVTKQAKEWIIFYVHAFTPEELATPQ